MLCFLVLLSLIAPTLFRGLLPFSENAETLAYICAAPLLSYTLYGWHHHNIELTPIFKTRTTSEQLQTPGFKKRFAAGVCGMIAMSYLATPDLQVFPCDGGDVGGDVDDGGA